MHRLALVLLPLLAVACQDYELKTNDPQGDPEPDIVVDPIELVFDQAGAGQTQVLTVEVTNIGNAALDLDSVIIEGSGAFTVLTESFPMMLSTDETIEVDIAFSPVNDTDSATALFLSDDPDTPEAPVLLMGTWAVPRLQVDPNPYDFGELPLQCKDSIELTFTNIGTGVLVIDQMVEIGEGFELESTPSLPLELAEGQSDTAIVTYNPLYIGEATAALHVSSNDPAGIIQVKQSGFGTNDGICLPVGEGERVPLTLEFPVEYRVGDVAFVLDTTSSMSGLAQAVAGEFATIAGDLADKVPDITFGLATYEDYNYSDMGTGQDKPFVMRHQQTSDLASVQSALDAVYVHNGSDETESTMEALYQAATGAGYDQDCDGVYDSSDDVSPFIASGADPFGGAQAGTYNAAVEGTGSLGGMGFRDDVLPIIIYATDAPLRDPDTGYSSPGGCHQDAGSSDVVSAFSGIGAKLIGVGVRYSTTQSRYQQMVDLANATGSTGDMDGDGSEDPAVIIWSGTSADFREAVVDAVEGLVGNAHFDEVRLIVVQDEYGLVESIEPAAYTDVDAGTRVDFTITFKGEVASGETEQTIPVDFQLVADGDVILDTYTVHVLVPASG